jgi:hypothetical protein
LATAPPKRPGESCWLCRCDCGIERVVVGYRLTSGRSGSCGCMNREIVVRATTKHGHNRSSTARTHVYRAWASMLCRIRARRGENFRLYGSRGIIVCERWLKFENFLADMGEPPFGTTLDRKDNDGNYEPGNCRWATVGQQNHNRRPRTRSGCVGVYWKPHAQKWQAQICHNRRQHHLGYFGSVEQAKDAYDCALASIEAGKFDKGEKPEPMPGENGAGR